MVRAHLHTPYNLRRPVSYDRTLLDRNVSNKTFYLPETDRARLHEASHPDGVG